MYSIAFMALISSCQNAPEGETAQASEKKEASTTMSGTTYTVDNVASTINFVGSKPVGTHTGQMHLANGSLSIDNGNITGGKFEIDMSREKAPAFKKWMDR